MIAYVINLDRSPDRLAHVRQEFDRVGVPFTRLGGVDTLGWSEAEIEAFFHERPGFSAEERVPGDAGALLSHMKAWRAIAGGDEPVGAVFEDDVHLASDLAPLLSRTDWIPDDADIIRLESNSKMVLRGGRSIGCAPDRKLFRAASGTWGAAGYVLTRSAAARLADTPPEMHTHIDWLLFKPTRSPVAASLRCYQVLPAVCIQDHLLNGPNAQIRSIVSDGIRVVSQPKAVRRRLPLPWRKRPVPFRP